MDKPFYINKPDYVNFCKGKDFYSDKKKKLLYGFKSIEEVNEFERANKDFCETCNILFDIKKEKMPVFVLMSDGVAPGSFEWEKEYYTAVNWEAKYYIGYYGIVLFENVMCLEF